MLRRRIKMFTMITLMFEEPHTFLAETQMKSYLPMNESVWLGVLTKDVQLKCMKQPCGTLAKPFRNLPVVLFRFRMWRPTHYSPSLIGNPDRVTRQTSMCTSGRHRGTGQEELSQRQISAFAFLLYDCFLSPGSACLPRSGGS